jgi:diguanylate cyclase (GGDEF)-like protein
MDELTGIVNRRTALVVLEKQFNLATRKGEDLAVIYCDLDDLKGVNDGYGHAAGDECIKTACGILASSIRDSDTVGRLGGDEFLIVLPDCDAAGAAIIDSRIGDAIAAANEKGKARPYPVAISRGIARLRELPAPEQGGSHRKPQELVDLADARMYEAKRARSADGKAAGLLERAEGKSAARAEGDSPDKAKTDNVGSK